MIDAVLRGPAFEWAQWSTTMRVATSDPRALPAVKRLIQGQLAEVERAIDPTLHDSELRRLAERSGRPTRVSTVFSGVLNAALTAAQLTGGDVDPTLGDPLAPLHVLVGQSIRLPGMPPGVTVTVIPTERPGWQGISLDSAASMVTVASGVRLDLSLMGRAWATDQCAATVAQRLGIPVLIAFGGNIATAGPAPAEQWTVLAQDCEERRLGEPAALITVPAGAALATASTRSEQWARDAVELREIVRPATQRPERAGRREPDFRVWDTATVVASSCVQAATWSSAALLRGRTVLHELESMGLAARLIDKSGCCRYAGNWPEAAELADEKTAESTSR